jgi:hypothetical protein
MPMSHYQCDGPTGLTQNSTKTPGTIARIPTRSCSEHILFSSEKTISMAIPVTLGKQNEYDYAIASMTAQDIRKISFIPSLDFSLNMQEFTEHTEAVLRGGPPVMKWQRPLDASREKNIARYFWNKPVGASGFTRRESLIPGAVVLGDVGLDNTTISIHKLSEHGRNFAEVRVKFQLLEQCPTCSRDASDPDYPEIDKPYFSKCWNHGCTGHFNSVEPLQIIDGQHRTNGILMNSVDDETPVVFLLRDQEQEQKIDEDGFTKPTWRGISLALQAEIFERMNNGAEKLHPLHSKWISVVLNGSSLPAHEVEAFKLFSLTSGARGSSRWRGKGLYHPLKNQQPLLESLTLPQFSQTLLGTAGVGLLRYNSVKPKLEQIEEFLEAAYTSSAGGLFTGTIRPFRSPMIMSRILQSYDDMVRHVNAIGASLTSADYEAMWNLHSSNWTGYTVGWATFRTGSTDPQKLFRKFWNKMWQPGTDSSGATAYGRVNTQHTYIDSTGASKSIDWGALAGSLPVSSQTTQSIGTSFDQVILNLNPPFNAYGTCTIEVKVTYAAGSVELTEETVVHGGVSASKTLDFSTLVTPVASGDSADLTIRYVNQNGSRSEPIPTITF